MNAFFPLTLSSIDDTFLLNGVLNQCENLTKLNLSKTQVSDRGSHIGLGYHYSKLLHLTVYGRFHC